jgi:hypothetical protein
MELSVVAGHFPLEKTRLPIFLERFLLLARYLPVPDSVLYFLINKREQNDGKVEHPGWAPRKSSPKKPKMNGTKPMTLPYDGA